MKRFLLILIIFLFASHGMAQNKTVNSLPHGKYETVLKQDQHKWERGDIILINESQYKMSKGSEIGEYRFSITAQRVFFTSGPLKNLYARTATNDNIPVIVLPVAENQQTGMNLPSEILAYYRH